MYKRQSYAIGNFAERNSGFFKAVRAYGMSSSKSIVHALTPSIDGAYADMKEILNAGEKLAPCYFADNDLIAVGEMCIRDSITSVLDIFRPNEKPTTFFFSMISPLSLQFIVLKFLTSAKNSASAVHTLWRFII